MKKSQFLYKAQYGRCTSAYLIDLNADQTMMNYVDSYKCSSPINWFHNNLAKEDLLNLYWCHPHFAEQKSHNGSMRSLIDLEKQKIF